MPQSIIFVSQNEFNLIALMIFGTLVMVCTTVIAVKTGTPFTKDLFFVFLFITLMFLTLVATTLLLEEPFSIAAISFAALLTFLVFVWGKVQK